MQPPATPYDEDYYLRGKETGKSNYQDYKWVPDLTLPLADRLKQVLHVQDGDTFLDYGCARGYVVKALRMRGVDAWGHDISPWAVENCDPSVKGHVSLVLSAEPLSWGFIMAKDTMEHVPVEDLMPLLSTLVAATRKSLLLIVPLARYTDGPYLRDEDNADPTHCNAWPLEKWIDVLESVVPNGTGYVSGSFHYPGLKPASGEVPKSCGFIRFTRI